MSGNDMEEEVSSASREGHWERLSLVSLCSL